MTAGAGLVLAAQFDSRAALRAGAVTLPLIGLALLRNDTLWLQASLVTISLHIVREKVGLTPRGTLLQGLLIVAATAALLAALAAPPLFVLLCALMAAAANASVARGTALRSLGNFTFIPALYLACDSGEGHSGVGLLAAGLRLLPYCLAALLPVLLLAGLEQRRLAASNLARPWRLSYRASFGPAAPALQSALAVALAVGMAAWAVEHWAIVHGQWVIWSAASVVTGDVGTSPAKLHDRVLGALLGGPAGLLLGWLLPHQPPVYGLAALASVLTLVAFRHYLTAFATRCACISLAAAAANGTAGVAAERLANVVLGGLLGLACVLAVHGAAALLLLGRRGK